MQASILTAKFDVIMIPILKSGATSLYVLSSSIHMVNIIWDPL
jgi:hypothetical protein